MVPPRRTAQPFDGGTVRRGDEVVAAPGRETPSDGMNGRRPVPTALGGLLVEAGEDDSGVADLGEGAGGGAAIFAGCRLRMALILPQWIR